MVNLEEIKGEHKKLYKTPDMEIVYLTFEDIVTNSQVEIVTNERTEVIDEDDPGNGFN